MLGLRASGGLAVVSQQSRSTTWSLTRRLKHGAAGGRVRGPLGRTCLINDLELFLQPLALDAVWRRGYTYAHWPWTPRRVPIGMASARRLHMGRLGSMKPG